MKLFYAITVDTYDRRDNDAEHVHLAGITDQELIDSAVRNDQVYTPEQLCSAINDGSFLFNGLGDCETIIRYL